MKADDPQREAIQQSWLTPAEAALAAYAFKCLSYDRCFGQARCPAWAICDPQRRPQCARLTEGDPTQEGTTPTIPLAPIEAIVLLFFTQSMTSADCINCPNRSICFDTTEDGQTVCDSLARRLINSPVEDDLHPQRLEAMIDQLPKDEGSSLFWGEDPSGALDGFYPNFWSYARRLPVALSSGPVAAFKTAIASILNIPGSDGTPRNFDALTKNILQFLENFEPGSPIPLSGAPHRRVLMSLANTVLHQVTLLQLDRQLLAMNHESYTEISTTPRWRSAVRRAANGFDRWLAQSALLACGHDGFLLLALAPRIVHHWLGDQDLVASYPDYLGDVDGIVASLQGDGVVTHRSQWAWSVMIGEGHIPGSKIHYLTHQVEGLVIRRK